MYCVLTIVLTIEYCMWGTEAKRHGLYALGPHEKVADQWRNVWTRAPRLAMPNSPAGGCDREARAPIGLGTNPRSRA